MKKAEIVFPYETWLKQKDKILEIAEEHCVFYMTAHHHVFPPESTFEHIHLGMWFRSDNTIENVAKWFGLKPNSVQKIKGQESTYALYIGLHYNQSDKEPLTSETSEFYHSKGKSLLDFKKSADDHINLEAILDDIVCGRLKAYQVTKLDPVFLRKNKREIDNALSVYNMCLKGKGVAMDKTIFWIYGNAGKGKTTLAKLFASDVDDGAYYIASDSNPLDDYMGQPTLIIDDISTGTLTCKALLKLLDPFNTSSAGARYYNKMLTAHTIIITGTVSPSDWWKDTSRDHTDGNIHQLYRRLNGGIFHFLYDNDFEMEVTLYDGQGDNPVCQRCRIPQPVLDKVKALDNTATVRMQATFERFGLKSVSATVEDISTISDNPFESEDK